MVSLCRVFIAIAFLAPVLMAQTPSKSSNPERTGGADTSEAFARLTEQFIHESLVLSPATASQAGYHKHLDTKTGKTIELDAVLDDVGPQAIAAQRRFYQQWRERFHKQTPLASLSVQDAADWRLIDDQIAFNLLEFDRIQSYRYNPTQYVEVLGSALFQPFTEEYAPLDIRLGHILSRVTQIPRFLSQARQNLVDADPIYVNVAMEENEGNIGLLQDVIAPAIPKDSALRKRYDVIAPSALGALKDFSRWLEQDLGKRKPSRTWRLSKELYAEKFKLVMETEITPEQVLADAEKALTDARAEMLELATPMHRQMFPEHGDHSELNPREHENRVIGEVLQKISDDHPQRDQLLAAVEADLAGITQFIREKKIVALSERENLKVIPTPPFMRGTYSVAGFHGAPPLEPKAEAQYWVTPIDPKTPDAKAESKLREYNKWVLQWLTIHEALPGHYIQAEHANNLQPPTRRVLRALFSNGPYVEGWAEYIAQVMMDQGYAGGDPRYRLSYRKVWLRAIGNAILDVRMHTMGMTDEQALELMTQDLFQTQAEAEGKLRRAKLSSVQLPTYFVGTRQWWDVRRKYEATKGKDFTLMEFHERVLNQGALPLPLLERIIVRGTAHAGSQ